MGAGGKDIVSITENGQHIAITTSTVNLCSVASQPLSMEGRGGDGGGGGREGEITLSGMIKAHPHTGPMDRAPH